MDEFVVLQSSLAWSAPFAGFCYGKWVLRTNTELAAAEVALKYKQLWMVEEIFRSAKSLLETRPIFHKLAPYPDTGCDDTIRGHVFCSFLALVLRKELQARLQAAGSDPPVGS